MKEEKNKVTVGESDIVKIRLPRVKIANMYPAYKKVVAKAISGKKLTELQTYQLKFIFEVAKDFPEIPLKIKKQLANLYREQLQLLVDSEFYWNAAEIRDIIKELEEQTDL